MYFFFTVKTTIFFLKEENLGILMIDENKHCSMSGGERWAAVSSEDRSTRGMSGCDEHEGVSHV